MSGASPDAEARLARVRERVRKEELDAVVVTSDESIAYLTGFRPLQLERLFAVVVGAAGGGAVIVPRLDEGHLEAVPAELEPRVYDAGSNGLPELMEALAGARIVGVEEDHLTFARSRALVGHGFDLRPAGAIPLGLRGRKDAAEVERIRAACSVVEEVVQMTFATMREGDVERVVNARAEGWLRERGATGAHALILFGENAANPHGSPGDRVLARGDVVCADISACLDGYWGDMTRCATAGSPSPWALAAWEVVRRAQQEATVVAVAGRRAQEVDAAQRRVIESAPELGRCLHGAGHAIGLAVHEPPFLVPSSGAILEEGMILTIEPGIYERGIGGIRLEDDVLVRTGAPELLSLLPLDLVEVPV